MLTPEVIAYVAIVIVAFALRFWDLADRAMHHDESLHATYSWYLFKGRGYEHHPLMHGPLLFHLMAVGYVLFGVSEATSRIVPAAFGTALVLLPILLRPWLGRVGALAAAAMLAVSPSMLYFSRFVGAGAQDILVLCGMVVVVAGIWHYLRSGREQWIYLTAAGLMVGFTTKEVTYMLAAILVLYLNGAVAVAFAAQAVPEDGTERPLLARLRVVAFIPIAWFVVLFWPFIGGLRERLRLRELPRVGELLIVIGTLSAPMFSAGSQVVLERLGVVMARPAPIGDWTNEQLWGAIVIGGLMALAVYFGTAWDARRWLIAAAIFWGASITLFTTFFTNTDGVATGSRSSTSCAAISPCTTTLSSPRCTSFCRWC
jgi:dolichyl-phosphate-mannose--protein O-mannosyl transferase